MDGNPSSTEVSFDNDHETVLSRDLGQANPEANKVSIDSFKESIIAEVVKALSHSTSLHNPGQGSTTALSIAGVPSNDRKRSHDLQSQLSEDSISLHPIDEDVFSNDMPDKRTDNLSDLFPPRPKKPTEDQALNVADDILAQVDQEMAPVDTLGDKVMDCLAMRVVKHFKQEPPELAKDIIARNRLPANCSSLSVPIMNQVIKDLKNFQKVSPNERRLYNIQSNVLRATSAVTKLANMVLVADQGNDMVSSKDILRSSLDAVTFLGMAQAALSDARKINVKEILPEDVKNICNPCHKPTSYLFGDDIGKSIKDAKEAYRLSSNISGRNSTAKQQYYGRSTFTISRPQENNRQYQFAAQYAAHPNSFLGRGSKPPFRRKSQNRQKKN